jgi:organic hydroperoxide reductase OsmC/OhrA
MHHDAHQVCFIANSVKTEIVVEEREATSAS